MRSGRAVVGLDVISHTLPRRMRSASDAHHLPQPPPTHHLPCCPPPLASLRPAPPIADDACGDGCRECQPDLCPEDDYPGLRRSFAAHVYPSVVTSGGGWGGLGGRGGECVSCSLAGPPLPLPPPSCMCPDARCGRAAPMVAPPPCSGWGREALRAHSPPRRAHTTHDALDLHVSSAAADFSVGRQRPLPLPPTLAPLRRHPHRNKYKHQTTPITSSSSCHRASPTHPPHTSASLAIPAIAPTPIPDDRHSLRLHFHFSL